VTIRLRLSMRRTRLACLPSPPPDEKDWTSCCRVGGSSCWDSNERVSAESPKHLFHEFDRLDVVALTMIEGFGPATVRSHLAVIRSIGQPIDWAIPTGSFKAARAAASASLKKTTSVGARCIVDGDRDYPGSL